MIKKYGQITHRNILYLAWVVALTATVVSLFMSEVLKWSPCTLCWYQRIFMYPLAIILPIGIFLKDKNIHLYVLPLSVIGGVVALYHELLQIKVIPEYASCSNGISCTTDYLNLFGFVSIPLLSLTAFLTITLSMYIFTKSK